MSEPTSPHRDATEPATHDATEPDGELIAEELEEVAGGILIGLAPVPPTATTGTAVIEANAARRQVAPLTTNPTVSSKGNVL